MMRLKIKDIKADNKWLPTAIKMEQESKVVGFIVKDNIIITTCTEIEDDGFYNIGLLKGFCWGILHIKNELFS